MPARRRAWLSSERAAWRGGSPRRRRQRDRSFGLHRQRPGRYDAWRAFARSSIGIGYLAGHDVFHGVIDSPPTEEEKAQIRQRLQALEVEHHDLDDVIDRLVIDPAQDQLQLRRLKKRKLLLKDQIQRLRARLIPDIIA